MSGIDPDLSSSARQLDGSPGTLCYCSLDDMTQSLHAQGEEIWGQRTSLAETSRGDKALRQAPVPLYSHARRSNALHFQIDKARGDTNGHECLLHESPTYSIISFGEVNIQDHPALLPLFSSHGVNNFLQNENIVSNMPARDKARLGLIHNSGHESFHPLRQALRYDLVSNVA
ncbi:unnamed protein product [Linum trigynum]|uniref:Uncharacterized protein n=1 Tax=Linum trigynum TaxID=586398 RepID=A0AAV2EE47_9ROSI